MKNRQLVIHRKKKKSSSVFILDKNTRERWWEGKASNCSLRSQKAWRSARSGDSGDTCQATGRWRSWSSPSLSWKSVRHHRWVRRGKGAPPTISPQPQGQRRATRAWPWRGDNTGLRRASGGSKNTPLGMGIPAIRSDALQCAYQIYRICRLFFFLVQWCSDVYQVWGMLDTRFLFCFCFCEYSFLVCGLNVLWAQMEIKKKILSTIEIHHVTCTLVNFQRLAMHVSLSKNADRDTVFILPRTYTKTITHYYQ